MSNSSNQLRTALMERAPEIAEDPRVRPTIRIGAVGHRQVEPEAALEVSAAVARILRRLRQSAEAVLDSPGHHKDFSGPLELFAITPLAEGSDRIIARAALSEGFGLGVVLPFPASEYELTFDLSPNHQRAIDEFHELMRLAALPRGYGTLVLDGSSAEDRKTLSYRDCSSAVLRWSDAVVAILRGDRWDSESGHIVRQAIARGLTVFIVDPASPDSPRVAHNGLLLPPPTDVDALLLSAVSGILGIDPSSLRDEANAGRHLQTYRDEIVQCDLARDCDFERSGPYTVHTVATPLISWCAGLNGAIATLLRGTALRGNSRRSEPRGKEPGHAEQLPFDAVTAAPFVQLFLRHHRADAAADAYAELHRSAQILTVLLGILAASLALVGSYIVSLSSLCTVLELVCLMYAAFIVITAHAQGWLDRWLNYRLIAEVLRYAKYLLVCGYPMSFSDFGQTGEALSSQHHWTYDHCHQVLRALRIAMPGRAAALEDDALPSVRTYLVDECIGDQIGYHRRTATLRSAVAVLLQRLALSVAAITLLSVAAKLLIVLVARHPQGTVLSAVNASAIILPAVAGALLGLRGYGQHNIIGKRSGALVASLELKRHTLKNCTTIDQLGEQMSMTSGILLREADGWLEIFSDKHIEL